MGELIMRFEDEGHHEGFSTNMKNSKYGPDGWKTISEESNRFEVNSLVTKGWKTFLY